MIFHLKKTDFLGIIISSISIVKVFNEVIVNNGHFNYLLIYKQSQDPIELFFNTDRAKGG